MDIEKFNKVFRKGLVLNKTKEGLELPIVLEKYKLFCERLVTENGEVNENLLYGPATFCLRMLKRNPSSDIPEVKIEL